MGRGHAGWGVMLGAALVACGAASVSEGRPAEPTLAPSSPPVASPPWPAYASIPPDYRIPPPPAPSVCEDCELLRVSISSEAGIDKVRLCARRPTVPIKPIDVWGTLPRASVKACDPACCP